jgi:release factor glutamine methyltransferase
VSDGGDAAEEALSWRGLVDRSTARLVVAGIERADVEARWIVEQATGLDAAELLAAADEPATGRGVVRVGELVERRAAGEPLQYVLGSWPFGDLDLLVDRRVLIPRPETEVVAEVALEAVVELGARRGAPDPWGAGRTEFAVADLGTGSGALALALAAALPDAEVWATDVSRDALAVARANLSGAGLPATRIRLAEGSWFDALPGELRGTLRLVVSNPPYIAEHEVATLPDTVARWEPRPALVSGPTGLEAIEVIVRSAPEWLEPGGVLVCELAPHQSGHARELALDSGFGSVDVRRDLTGRDRMIVARRNG